MDFQKRQKQLTRYLLKTTDTLEWKEQELIERLEITSAEWEKIVTGRRYVLIDEFCRLAESLEVNLDDFYNEKLSLSELKRRMTVGPDHFLPEKYMLAQQSRMRTSASLLDFIGLRHGPLARQRILRKLQVSEAMVENREQMVNMGFFIDICDTVKSYGCSDDFLVEMGGFSSTSNRNSSFAREFEKLSGPKEVYESLVDTLGVHFEKNHQYSIGKLTSSLCDIRSRPNPAVLEALKAKKLGSKNSCLARQGVATSFALYHGHRNVVVEETKCIHRGDPECVYRVKWAPLPVEKFHSGLSFIN